MMKTGTNRYFALNGLLLLLIVGSAYGQDRITSDQPHDEEYTQQILAHTTADYFVTPYVDHLPASDTVPTPLDFLGHIAGAPDVLSYSHEVFAYMRAVAEASPRVEVVSAGTSEEGREMILVIVSAEDTIANLDHFKSINNQLADPRAITDEIAAGLVAEGKPIYWATGAMHSPETGSPEMLMELVYRLAVEESEFIQSIRDNLIFMTTPVLDVDGRDKRVDLLKLRQAGQRVPNLLYWGKYVAHDNNRDGMILELELSRHLMRTFLEYKPQVLHDLHESASHLYTSTGTGPYNAWIDPILVDEWHVLAYQEITELTKQGVPGVWTHNFYDGWAPNYGFYAANGHNAIGRFYETQGAGDANTRMIRSQSTREWYRPNPPLAETLWSIRNNVNMQQAGLLIAMNYMANHRRHFMENFYLKSKRSVAKPFNEGPAAYVFPADDPRPGQSAALLNVLKRQGCEVHRTVRDATIGETHILAGSHVVRMDQPYSRMADMLLDRAYYNASDPRPYDDTGWTLGPLFNAQVTRIEDVAVLDVRMEEVIGDIHETGGVEMLTNGDAVAYLINHNADNELASFRFAYSNLTLHAAEESFEMGGLPFNAGTFVAVVTENNHGEDVAAQLGSAGDQYGFTAFGVSTMPDVPMHEVEVPRVAVMHTWQTTQNEGWMRMALDAFSIPYEYISVHEVRDDPNLRDKYDVILFGPSRGDALGIVEGLPMTGSPIPWKASDIAPNIGRQDETDDMRGGLEFEGVVHLRDFVKSGGVLITIQNSSDLPVHFGLAQGVSIVETEDLNAAGSVLAAQFVDDSSPIRYGYDDELGVYFRQSPVFRTGGGGFRRGGRGGFGGGGGGSDEERLLSGEARPTGRGTIDDPDRVQARSPEMGQEGQPEGGRGSLRQGRGGGNRGEGGGGGQTPRAQQGAVRTILRFHEDHTQLLISGLLAGGDELAGTPTVIDAPLGDGHVVLFGINPMWRHETQGMFSLVFNSILHYNDLHVGTVGGGDDEEEVEEE